MFKNLARIDAFRSHAVPNSAAPAYCNDNRPGRRLAAAAQRAGQQRLTCHWRAAGGRLECHWQAEPADDTAAEAPGPSCTRNRPRRLAAGLSGFATRGQAATRVA
jgi:hypothetical protein